jgi:hypothetical protein
MLISKNKDFVFFHIPKTAGGSITVLLSKYSDNHNKDKQPINKSKPGWMTRYHVPTKRQSFNHMHSFVDPSYNDYDCKNMFSFSFVRNPYTRIISLYKFLKKYEKVPFLRFCKYLHTHRPISITQYKYLSLDNKIPLDFVGKYENIKEDFNYVCEQIGIPERYINLGFEHKADLINYKDYYCAEYKEIVDKVFDIDFKTFNYKKEL